ncbi:hypothetical protein EL84_21470 [Paenibacillus sp. VT-400]|nr:hypothetical protein EL84_21470 [Paenibacillus sp. VT-400]
MLYVILVGSFVAMVIEFRALKEKHYIREIVCGMVLFAVGVILNFLRIAHIELPSPLVGIRILFQPLSEFITTILS